ncbi:MAG: benzoylformate decarboxylase, partial [Candidatus Eremiobacteraeota bacterium]|nr:benzoylformate decarboxylase [Candidatus Eremiobacteraeota bacterium]
MLPSEPFLFAASAATMPQPYVKWSIEPARAQDVPAAIARAAYVAASRPMGPAFVSVPEDDWAAQTQAVPARSVRDEIAPDPLALDDVRAAIERARKPAIVAGAGVDRDGATTLAVELAERIGARVWSSALTGRCGFPEDHARFEGALPRSRAGVVETLRGCDFVLVLGAPVFNYHVHSEGPFIDDGTTVVQLTDDPSAASYAVVGTSVITTLRPALEALLAALPARAVQRPPARERTASAAGDPIAIEYLLDVVRRTMPGDAILVEEAPAVHSVLHDCGLLQPGRFFTCASGSLGYGLPAAIGASLAAPGRAIVALLGDGSSYYGIQALWNAAQERLPIVFVIVNNASYGAMNSFGAMLAGGKPTPSFEIAGTDFVALAAGFGVTGSRVARAADLEPVLRDALATRAPHLLDVVIDASPRHIR